MKVQEPEPMEQDWTFAYPTESLTPPLAQTDAEAPRKQTEFHAIEVMRPATQSAISAESAGARKLPPREALSESDLQKLSKSSITREDAERAGVFRVSHET